MPGFLEATLTALRGVLDLCGQQEVLLDKLPGVTLPTLIIWGVRDRVFPSHHARAAAERLPNGQLALIPACGHLPQVEAPERFVAALGSFLRPEAAAAPAVGSG